MLRCVARALGSQSRSSAAPSRPDAPTKPNLVAILIVPSGRATQAQVRIAASSWQPAGAQVRSRGSRRRKLQPCLWS